MCGVWQAVSCGQIQAEDAMFTGLLLRIQSTQAALYGAVRCMWQAMPGRGELWPLEEAYNEDVLDEVRGRNTTYRSGPELSEVWRVISAAQHW